MINLNADSGKKVLLKCQKYMNRMSKIIMEVEERFANEDHLLRAGNKILELVSFCVLTL